MTLERLRAIVPPPAEPVETGSEGDWPKVEAALGTALPDDFKRFTGLYGSGKFDDFLFLFNPFAPDGQDGNLLYEKDAVLAAYAETRAKFPDRLPWPPFPEAGGVLPAGRSDNGDELYWVTEGAPDGWGVALVESRAASHELHPTPVTGFLADLVDGALRTKILPPEILERAEHVFEPFA
jgi:hypothetical protein